MLYRAQGSMERKALRNCWLVSRSSWGRDGRELSRPRISEALSYIRSTRPRMMRRLAWPCEESSPMLGERMIRQINRSLLKLKACSQPREQEVIPEKLLQGLEGPVSGAVSGGDLLDA